MLFVTGLGINPAMMATVNTAAFRPGAPQIATTGAAPGYSINQHTLYQVFTEMFPGLPWYSAKGETPATATGGDFSPGAASARADAWRAKIRAAATASGMPQCPAGAVTDNGASCYYGRGANAQYLEEANGSITLLPLGSFQVYGVVFKVDDLKGGRFSKVFNPNATQRKLIEWAAIRRSAQRLLGENATRALAPFGGKVSSDGNPSVDQVMARVPEIALYWINFDRNPVQPTPTERTQPGGWASWIKRGGYPLSREVLQAKASVSDGALGIEYCASIMCQCTTSTGKEPGTGREMVAGGFPSCMPQGFPEGSAFWPYISVHQGIGDPVFEVTLIHDDPSWITKVGEAGQVWMDRIVMGACAAGTATANPYALAMCALYAGAKALQAKESKLAVTAMPLPEMTFPTPPSTPSGPPLPPGPTSVPTSQRYAGCFARFNKTRKIFSIYCPTPPAGLAAYSGFSGLAVGVSPSTVTPPPPLNTTLVAETPTLPGEGEAQAGVESDKFFRVSNPFMWLAFAGAAATLGTGSYVIYRRKRAA